MSETAEPTAKKAPWGAGIFLRVIFPCQVHQNADGTYTARCREAGIVSGDFADQERALNDLRVSIRTAAAKQRVVR